MPVRLMKYVFVFDEQFTHKFDSKEMAYYEAFNSGRKTIHQRGIILVNK
jgi:hypothetical protein